MLSLRRCGAAQSGSRVGPYRATKAFGITPYKAVVHRLQVIGNRRRLYRIRGIPRAGAHCYNAPFEGAPPPCIAPGDSSPGRSYRAPQLLASQRAGSPPHRSAAVRRPGRRAVRVPAGRGAAAPKCSRACRVAGVARVPAGRAATERRTNLFAIGPVPSLSGATLTTRLPLTPLPT